MESPLDYKEQSNVVRFKNSIFLVTFIVAYRPAIDVIFGTCSLNKNAKAIECIAGKIVFQHNKTKVAILDSRTGKPIESKPLSKEHSSEVPVRTDTSNIF